MGFGFKDLEVWRKAVRFTDEIISLSENLDTTRKHYRLVENFEAAAVSVALNIAEGKGRHSKKEYIYFLYVARGSLYETVTRLAIYQRLGWLQEEDFTRVKEKALTITKMINALITSIRKRD